MGRTLAAIMINSATLLVMDSCNLCNSETAARGQQKPCLLVKHRRQHCRHQSIDGVTPTISKKSTASGRLSSICLQRTPHAPPSRQRLCALHSRDDQRDAVAYDHGNPG
ncbi:hypothetical protein PAXRUDRAFT_264422 [Paxillus rubicundulus Ve08.2h10]|uniref:Secreted protein n=1 Tax=Paxillus rubicundulus Ve08.2h10 TaxID=930991 RepID=A0A0D0DT97_9AGAM|nr:hypothetical protein PAXRUDRAFT_264422 [Paxillus rubicundulus Ve08.2h10]